MSKHFYITTTLPYVNAAPHVGFAMEIIRADVVARTKEAQGYQVFFNTGTDEHGQKIYDTAKANNEDPQAYVDRLSENFKALQGLLGLHPGLHFVRTTDNHHKAAAQAFWIRCREAGDIYKKLYKVKYCVGCELEKTDSELVDGRCPLHPNKDLEIREEENYFFRFSAYGQKLLSLYQKNPTLVVPDFRFGEIKKFVERGLEDFSISRLASKMSWGVPVPDDSEHVMYVWFDALVNYISTLGWPEDQETFANFWQNGTPVQYAGKDNLRQQAAMWQAMLLSAGLPPTATIVINGFVTADGQKMSKSLGNVISPEEVVSLYGRDVLRYYVLRELSSFEDSPLTLERIKETYNSNLAHGLGNLVSRIMKLSQTHLAQGEVAPASAALPEELLAHIDRFELQKAMDYIWERIREIDVRIQEDKPFTVVKTDLETGKEMIRNLVVSLSHIANMLSVFLPETAQAIHTAIQENKLEAPLFLKKE